MKKQKNNLIILIIAVVAVFSVAILVVLIYKNRIAADQEKAEPVVTPANVKTLPVTETLKPNPDTRAEVVVPILMYHHIRDYNDPADSIGTNLSVPPINFKAQIDYLKNNGYTTITFADFTAFPAKKLPDKPIILTFDDGYNDAYSEAFQLLKANKQVGTFYLISSYFGKPEHLSREQAKEMSANGMEIGSHTVSHPDLTKISATKVAAELLESKTTLESIISKSIVSFCYPAGKHNEAVDLAAKNSGYSTATTTYMAISNTSEDKFTLSRLRINPSDGINYFADRIQNYKHQE